MHGAPCCIPKRYRKNAQPPRDLFRPRIAPVPLAQSAALLIAPARAPREPSTMIRLEESSRADDRTLNAMLFDASVSGDWSLVEHFMLGNAANALPDVYRDDNQAL